MIVHKPFRYSGNKKKTIEKCSFTLPEFNRIVEPFMGSACFSIAQNKPWMGIDSNPEVVAMMEWLKEVSETRLYELKEYEGTRVSIKDLPISDVEKTYLRINISGVYTGQLNSWIIYEQHKLPVEETIKCLPAIRKGKFFCGDAFQYDQVEGDLLFVDPPYLGTDAGYKSKKAKHGLVDIEDIKDLLYGLEIPWIFTYGEGAEELFPEYRWNKVYTRKVPNIRAGGVIERTEHICFNYDAQFERK